MISTILPKKNRITVRRHILKKILPFRTFFFKSDRWERTIDTPIIQTNHGNTKSARVKPFQTKQNQSLKESIFPKKKKEFTRMIKKPIVTTFRRNEKLEREEYIDKKFLPP